MSIILKSEMEQLANNLEPKVTFTTDLWVGKVKIPVRTELDFNGLHSSQHEKNIKACI